MVTLDVTSDESVMACVATVLAQAGRIDVLVNNVGVEFTAALEETTIDDYKWLFETNVYGLIRMTQAVLPHMRERGSGKIINVGSAAGDFGVPFQSAYTASKHAVKGLTDALRYEVKPFGVQVAVVQPGIFKSEISNRSGYSQTTMPAYDTPRKRVIAAFHHRINTGPDPFPVTAKIHRIITGQAHGWYHPVGFEAIMTGWRRLFPPALWTRQIEWKFNLYEQRHTFFFHLMGLSYRLMGRTDGRLPDDVLTPE
jgi:NAD(P)-dependent dehydrogenase (short-subunit alcohol dehydrogenase family)